MCLILHPNVERNICPFFFIQETVQKLQKETKNTQKEKEKNKNPRDSQVIVIACLHHTRTVCT